MKSTQTSRTLRVLFLAGGQGLAAQLAAHWTWLFAGDSLQAEAADFGSVDRTPALNDDQASLVVVIHTPRDQDRSPTQLRRANRLASRGRFSQRRPRPTLFAITRACHATACRPGRYSNAFRNKFDAAALFLNATGSTGPAPGFDSPTEISDRALTAWSIACEISQFLARSVEGNPRFRSIPATRSRT